MNVRHFPATIQTECLPHRTPSACRTVRSAYRRRRPHFHSRSAGAAGDRSAPLARATRSSCEQPASPGEDCVETESPGCQAAIPGYCRKVPGNQRGKGSHCVASEVRLNPCIAAPPSASALSRACAGHVRCGDSLPRELTGKPRHGTQPRPNRPLNRVCSRRIAPATWGRRRDDPRAAA